jgi:hypothetical protein
MIKCYSIIYAFKPLYSHDKMLLNYFKTKQVCGISLFPYVTWQKELILKKYSQWYRMYKRPILPHTPVDEFNTI